MPMAPAAPSDASSATASCDNRTSTPSPMGSPGTTTPWTEVGDDQFASASTHHRSVSEVRQPPLSLPEPQMQQPIAIVGMACRLPGNVSTPTEFWELCSRGRSGFMSGVPKDRFNHEAFYHPNPGKTGSYHAAGGYFLDGDLASFDAPFFSLTEKEALAMDPQQRLLLECTFEALESAGLPKHAIVGKDVGVFVGGSLSEYEVHLMRDSDTIPIHQATGCAQAMQSNRLSHFFDLRGPSFTLDTACSASLTALHVACQSLRVGEASAAIVGGCHLNMLPESFISFSSSRLLSDTGRSIAFDERGTGFGRGEGCGIIILKPLDQALRDGDPVRAVIHGTGINQDGKTAGITMPNGDAQERLIKQVYKSAGLDPHDCGFVEAHGTGTKIGDPTEAGAIYRALGQGRKSTDPLFLGSVKSNIGHLEAASGIAAVIKATLMLERGFILPNHDFKKPNPKIPWKEYNMKIPNTQRPWPRGKKYVSVNNFGFGGTNAHVVLGKAPYFAAPKASTRGSRAQSTSTPAEEKSQSGPTRLFVMSGNDKASLEMVMKKMIVYLEQRPEIFQSDLLNNLAHTLSRRSLLKWRVAIPAATSFDLIDAVNSNKVIMGRELGEDLRIGFVFTGQGAQWFGMGRELYGLYPAYTAAMDRADAYLQSIGSPWSLIDELLGVKDVKACKLSEAHICQPACTAVQLCLIDLLRTWGIRPTAVVGHSSGEIAAAYAAGIITFETAMAAAYHRGRMIPILKQNHPELVGSMMAVGMKKEEVEEIMQTMPEPQQQQVRIACYNSPSSLTMSGDAEGLTELEKAIEEKMPDAFKRKLQVDVAYHSHHMNLVADEYRNALLESSLPPPKPSVRDVRFYSSLHGREITGVECNQDYWTDNLTCPVRFSEALKAMATEQSDSAVNMLVELGPHSALQGPIKQILSAAGMAGKVPYGSALVRKKTAVESAMELAATLITKGAELNMTAINFPTGLNKKTTVLTDLPRYAWNHEKRYWHEASRLSRNHRLRGASDAMQPARSDLIGVEAVYSNPVEPTWRNILSLDDLPWLRHHRVQGVIIFPMSGFIAMALEAVEQRWAQQHPPQKSKDGAVVNPSQNFDKFELRDVQVVKPLAIPAGADDGGIELTISLRRRHDGAQQRKETETWDEFRICSWTSTAGWTEHCAGLVATRAENDKSETTNKAADGHSIEALASLCRSEMIGESIAAVQNPASVHVADASSMYEAVSDRGVEYGPSFQGITDYQSSNTYAVGKIASPAIAQPDNVPVEFFQCKKDKTPHPTLLESMIEMYWPVLVGNPMSATDDTSANKTIYLPTSLRHMCISRDIATIDGVKAYCKARGFATPSFPLDQPQPTDVDIVATAATDGSDNKLLVEIDGLTVAPILDSLSMESGLDNADAARKLCYKQELEPLSPEETSGANSPAVLPDVDVTIVHGELNDGGVSFMMANQLAVALETSTSRLPDLISFQELQSSSAAGFDSSKGKICIFLVEADKPFLARLTKEQFGAIQNMTATYTQGILWVTRGAYQQSTSPESNMISGLSRTVRSESALPFATLDLDGQGDKNEVEGAVRTILDVYTAAFATKPTASSPTDREMEYVERAGKLLTPRIADDDEMNEYIHRQTAKNPRGSLELQPFDDAGRNLRMKFGGHSGPKAASLETSLQHFVDDSDRVKMPLADDEIEFQVKAVGVSMQDANTARLAKDAEHKSTSPAGVEASGIVTRIGREVDAASFPVGCRIAGLTTTSHGGYATRARTTSSTAVVIPESEKKLSFEQAAAFPLAYCTAYYSLMDQARLQAGQHVLITSAAGAMGQAAISLARDAGASVLVTVGSEKERTQLQQQYAGFLSKEHILCHGSEEASRSSVGMFEVAVQRITQGRGVDVLLDLSGGSVPLSESWACLSRFGSLVRVAQVESNTASRSATSESELLRSASSTNVSLMRVDMSSLVAERTDILHRLVANVSRLLLQGKIRPIESLQVFPFSQAEAAFQSVQSKGESGLGKVVLTPSTGDLVMATPAPKASSEKLLRQDASYIIVGGTGGLGRSMARWMVSNGAGTIVLLSRRATETTSGSGSKVDKLVEDARAAGATVLVRQCDVAKEASVASLFTTGLIGLAPVRGIVHSAMVLRDVLFDKMTWEDYVTVIESKVQGAWNLHQQSRLSAATSGLNLDFFVAISSVSGVVGNRGQAAYAAANTFLDALVQHRRSLGLPAATLALAAVSDAGYLADEEGGAERAAEVARNLGSADNSICEAEVLALLGVAISGGPSGQSHNDNVFMTGMSISVNQANKGAKRPFWAVDAKFKALMAADIEAQGEDATGEADKAIKLSPALSASEAEDVVCRGLVAKIAQVLMMEPEDLDVTRTLAYYPLDSLVAIEIRNFIAREYEASMQVLELLSSGSIQMLSRAVCKKSKLCSGGDQ